MDSCYTIRAMRAHDGKIGHANFALGTLFYKAYALNPSFILGKASSDLVNEAVIDFVNNLQMTRQHPLKPDERPFLESVRQESVISIGQSPLGKIPSFVPN